MVKATDLNYIFVGIIFDICFIRERRFEPCRCRIRLVNFLLSFWVGFVWMGSSRIDSIAEEIAFGEVEKEKSMVEIWGGI